MKELEDNANLVTSILCQLPVIGGMQRQSVHS